MKLRIFYLLALCLLPLSIHSAPQDTTADEQTIRDNAKAYVQAFNTQNAKKLASQWTEDAEYSSPFEDAIVQGREAIEEQFEKLFSEQKEISIEFKIDSIDFITPYVAVERGIATVTFPGKEPTDTSYTVVHVKQGDQWFINSVDEVNLEKAPNNEEKLKELAWMIGDWSVKEEEGTVDMNITWDKSKNFITQLFSVSIHGKKVLRGRVIIAWDSNKEQFRSWLFDSDGGFAEGSWKQKGKKWIVTLLSTLPDGHSATSTNIYEPIDENTYAWESVDREVNGELLPNSKKVEFKKR